jgi:hypothetical protein
MEYHKQNSLGRLASLKPVGKIPNSKIQIPNRFGILESKRFEHWYLVIRYCFGFGA